MNTNSQKNRDLRQQFPFVETIIATPVQLLEDGMDSIDDLTIKVERADGDLFFRKADNIGIADSGCIFSTSGNREGLIAKRAEYLYAVDDNGTILNSVDWPKSRHLERGCPVYAYTVLWATKQEKGYSDPIHERTKHLVWVTVENWHTQIDGDDVSFGDIQSRDVAVTVFQEPKCGFWKLHEKSNVYDNLSLDSHTLTSGVVRNDYDLITIGGALYELAQFFQDFVYFNGMADILEATELRGASGMLDNIEVLAAEMCGYTRVMLENKVCYVSFQVRPGSKNMYMLGCRGTLPQIRKIVRDSIRLWDKSKYRNTFKPNENVSVM